MADIRLKDGNGVPQTYPGVTKVVLKDTNGDDVAFEQAVSGASKVTLLSDGATFQIISVPTGNSISKPTSPTKSGYVFVGWATTSSATIPDISFPYTVSEDTIFHAVYNTVVQLKSSITGYGTSSPSSVTFSTNSELRNWTPETVTLGSDVFIKFPTMYRKVVATSDGQITSFIISSWKEDADFHPYSVFIDETGNLLPYVLMGKYCSTSSSTANSISGSATTMPIGTGRTICRNKGTGYQQYDWQFQSLWKDLICAKKQTVNINSGSSIKTDALGIEWYQGSSYTYPWVDGVSWQGATKQWAICYHPSKYADQATSSTTGYQLAGYTSGGTSGQEISKLGYDSANEFFNYPTATVNNSNYGTYYCDSFSFGTSPTHPVSSYVGRTNAYYGAFYCDASDAWSDACGVRLCYRPLGE